MEPITLRPAPLTTGDPESAARAGDRADEEFAALYEAHHNAAYRTALAVLGRHEAALDAVQETFLKVHRGLSQWRGESSLRTWIVRIAVRCAIDLQRKANRRRETDESAAEPFHDPRMAIEEALRLARLREVAEGLTGQAGIILRLRLFGGQSNKDIAAHLGLSEANVRVQLSNAVRRLKEMV